MAGSDDRPPFADSTERCSDCGAVVGTWSRETDRLGHPSLVWHGSKVVKKERILPGTLMGVPLIGPNEQLCSACARKRG